MQCSFLLAQLRQIPDQRRTVRHPIRSFFFHLPGDGSSNRPHASIPSRKYPPFRPFCSFIRSLCPPGTTSFTIFNAHGEVLHIFAFSLLHQTLSLLTLFLYSCPLRLCSLNLTMDLYTPDNISDPHLTPFSRPSTSFFHFLPTYLLVLGVITFLWRCLNWCVQDYQAFKALGRGGTPYNVYGWLSVTFLLKPFTLAERDTLWTGDYPDGAHKEIQGLPDRQGQRPDIRGIAPQRQFSQCPNQEMNKVSRDGMVVWSMYGTSAILTWISVSSLCSLQLSITIPTYFNKSCLVLRNITWHYLSTHLFSPTQVKSRKWWLPRKENSVTFMGTLHFTCTFLRRMPKW